MPEINHIKFCKRCTMSNQRPRITFDAEGVCSACNYAEYKRTKIDWDARELELRALCDKYRKGNGDYDVIVPCSGGKDSGFVAHQLKYVYGMTPLTVTWASLLDTDVGKKNLDAFINSGFDNLLAKPNGRIMRKLAALTTEHMGEPFQPFIYGQTNFPLQVSVNYRVPLIMYGENGEVEYGGDMKNALRPDRDVTDHDKHYFSGRPPSFWSEHGISEADLKPFMAPSFESIQKNQTKIHFMGYYKLWSPPENYAYCAKNTGFTASPVRSEGTYTHYASLDDAVDGIHYYLGYIKFGIGRATSDSAHEIRDGKITRDEGISLVRKFDGEFPHKHYRDFLEYCSFTEDEFHGIVNKWRPTHLWDGDKLRYPIWQSAR